MKKKSVHTILHPIERWCECTMPKNSEYEIFVAYDNNKKSRTHSRQNAGKGFEKKFNIFFTFSLSYATFAFSENKKTAFLGSRRF